MDTSKITQAAAVLNTTLDTYFNFDPDRTDAAHMAHLKMTLPTIMNLLEASASLLNEGIAATTE